MNRTGKRTPDLYLSCATLDRSRADTIASRLRDAEFRVERVSELEWHQAVAAEREDTVWRALRESAALVILGTRNHIRSPVLTMEVGAALSEHKPIYVLVDPDAADDLPSYLQHKNLVPLSETERLVELLDKDLRPRGKGRSRSTRS